MILKSNATDNCSCQLTIKTYFLHQRHIVLVWAAISSLNMHDTVLTNFFNELLNLRDHIQNYFQSNYFTIVTFRLWFLFCGKNPSALIRVSWKFIRERGRMLKWRRGIIVQVVLSFLANWWKISLCIRK
jgi:hypothetical protein